MSRKSIAILFGGVSAEHEVSVITGLQVLENIDRSKYDIHAICLSKNNTFLYYPELKTRKDFFKIKPKEIYWGSDKKGSFIRSLGFVENKIYIDAAYMSFHGGNGESGQMQGFLEVVGVPYTSSNLETSVISMNKVLTKEVLEANGIKTIPWVRVFADEIKRDLQGVVKLTLKTLEFPLIIKPVHLGSSIAINIAKTNVELKKHLLEASFADSEVLVEKYIKGIREFNISVRKVNGKILTSEIQEPLSKDEILSFADKYQRGGKKTGGMAAMVGNLPAKIPAKLKKDLLDSAVKAYKAIRADNLLRIDFLYDQKNIYVIEVNPIPGSMSFFLWEASGISFKDQITDSLNQAISVFNENKSRRLDYKTDIVENFIDQL